MSTNRWAGARCANRPDLPWTADTAPGDDELRAMNALCAECPVLTHCASYALTGGDGGFYAGIWLPWSKTLSESLITNRRHARSALRHVARSVKA